MSDTRGKKVSYPTAIKKTATDAILCHSGLKVRFQIGHHSVTLREPSTKARVIKTAIPSWPPFVKPSKMLSLFS